MRILTLKEVVDGRIPRIEDFDRALAEFEHDCVTRFLDGPVIGAFAYGSAVRNDFTVASDIDYLMVISDQSHHALIQDAVHSAMENYDIWIQPRVIHIDQAISGMHPINPSFRQHLKLTAGRRPYFGTNPLELLADNRVSFDQSLRSSMIHYVSGLSTKFDEYGLSEHHYNALLKHIIEKPFHAARVMVQHHHGAVCLPGDVTFVDSKDQIIKAYSTLDGCAHLVDDLCQIHKTSKMYVAFLEEAQRSHHDSRQGTRDISQMYMENLESIKDCYPHALAFLTENLRLMKSPPDQTLRSPTSPT